MLSTIKIGLWMIVLGLYLYRFSRQPDKTKYDYMFMGVVVFFMCFVGTALVALNSGR